VAVLGIQKKEKPMRWIPACAGMTGKGEKHSGCHAGLEPASRKNKRKMHWIPAFAGMTVKRVETTQIAF